MARRCLVLAAFALVLAIPSTAEAGGYCRGKPVTSAEGTTVQMKNYCFAPRVLYVDPGDEVTWTNLDSDPHTVTGAGDWGTGHKELGLNQSVSFRFDQEGTFPYSCLLHPGMDGVVVVGDGQGPGDTNTIVLTGESVDPPTTDTSAVSDASDDDGISVLSVGLALITALVGFGAGRLTGRLAPTMKPEVS